MSMWYDWTLLTKIECMFLNIDVTMNPFIVVSNITQILPKGTCITEAIFIIKNNIKVGYMWIMSCFVWRDETQKSGLKVACTDTCLYW